MLLCFDSVLSIAASLVRMNCTSFCPWERHKNTYFLTGTLCGVEDEQRCLFHNCKYRKKNIKKPKKNQAEMLLPLSPKMDLVSNCPVLD